MYKMDADRVTVVLEVQGEEMPVRRARECWR
jgi:hypothetical protein